MKKMLLFALLIITIQLSTFYPAHANMYFGMEYTSDPESWIGNGKNFTTADLKTYNIGIRNFGDNGLHGYVNWIDQSGSHKLYLDISAPDNQLLHIGTYTGATRWPFQDPGVPGLSFGGENRESNAYWGIFNILEISYNRSVPSSVAVNWKIYDTINYTGGEPNLNAGLYGQFRYNTKIPFSAPVPIPSTICLLGAGLIICLIKKK